MCMHFFDLCTNAHTFAIGWDVGPKLSTPQTPSNDGCMCIGTEVKKNIHTKNISHNLIILVIVS